MWERTGWMYVISAVPTRVAKKQIPQRIEGLDDYLLSGNVLRVSCARALREHKVFTRGSWLV